MVLTGKYILTPASNWYTGENVLAIYHMSHLHPYEYAKLESIDNRPATTMLTIPPVVDNRIFKTPSLPLKWLGDISDE